MFASIRRLLGIGPRHMIVRQIPVVHARYDAAQTTPDKARHWAAADALSANTPS